MYMLTTIADTIDHTRHSVPYIRSCQHKESATESYLEIIWLILSLIPEYIHPRSWGYNLNSCMVFDFALFINYSQRMEVISGATFIRYVPLLPGLSYDCPYGQLGGPGANENMPLRNSDEIYKNEQSEHCFKIYYDSIACIMAVDQQKVNVCAIMFYDHVFVGAFDKWRLGFFAIETIRQCQRGPWNSDRLRIYNWHST